MCIRWREVARQIYVKRRTSVNDSALAGGHHFGSSYSENWLMSCINDNNLLSLHNAKAALEVAWHSLYQAMWRRGSIWESMGLCDYGYLNYHRSKTFDVMDSYVMKELDNLWRDYQDLLTVTGSNKCLINCPI